jgi:hypothetical protein
MSSTALRQAFGGVETLAAYMIKRKILPHIRLFFIYLLRFQFTLPLSAPNPA